MTMTEIDPTETPDRRVKMTERWAASVKPGDTQIDWYDTEADGLVLRVNPGGTKTWGFRYRYASTQRRLTIGRFSDALGVSEARSRAGDHAKIVADGGDPAHARKKREDGMTFAELWQRYFDVYLAKKSQKHRDDGRQRYERRLKKAFGSRRLTDIHRDDIVELLDPIVLVEKKHRECNATKSQITQMFSFAVESGWVQHHPCYGMKKRGIERTRTTLPGIEQIGPLVDALVADGGDAAQAVYLRLLFGKRGQEVHQMRWADVSLKKAVWVAPAEFEKTRMDHVVPLVGAALDLLKTRAATRVAHEPRVFPELAHQSKKLRKLKKLHRGKYRWHDLRRAFETYSAALGIPEWVTKRVRNEKAKGDTSTTRVYNVWAYELEKRCALIAWDAAIARLQAGAELMRVRWAELVEAVATRAQIDWSALLYQPVGDELDGQAA